MRTSKFLREPELIKKNEEGGNTPAVRGLSNSYSETLAGQVKESIKKVILGPHK